MAADFSQDFGLYGDLEELISLVTSDSNSLAAPESATVNLSSGTFLVDVG